MKEVRQVMNCREARRLEQRNLDEGDKESAGMGVPGQGDLEVAAYEVLQADTGCMCHGAGGRCHGLRAAISTGTPQRDGGRLDSLGANDPTVARLGLR